MNKPVLSVLSLLFLAGTQLSAWHTLQSINPERGPGFETSLMNVSGMLYEYVMIEDYTLSKLDWKMQFFSLTGELAIPVSKRSILNFGFLLGIPGQQSGIMEDRDWANKDSNGYTLDGEYTNYSIHDNFLNINIAVDINMTTRLLSGKTFSFALLYGGCFEKIKFTARDGYLEYPPGSTPIYLSGDVITYKVKRLFPYAGAAGEFSPGRKISGIITIIYTPLVFTDATDEHLLRSLRFLDLVNASSYLHVSASFKWRGPAFSAGIYFSYSNYFFKTGPSYVTYTSLDPNTLHLQSTTGAVSSSFFESGITLEI